MLSSLLPNKNKDLEFDLELFLIYDTKVSCYERPMFAINEHDLCRQVINMFRDPSQAQNKYLLNSEDYAIFKVGALHHKSGTLHSQNPTHVANMHDLRSAAQKQGIVPT